MQRRSILKTAFAAVAAVTAGLFSRRSVVAPREDEREQIPLIDVAAMSPERDACAPERARRPEFEPPEWAKDHPNVPNLYEDKFVVVDGGTLPGNVDPRLIRVCRPQQKLFGDPFAGAWFEKIPAEVPEGTYPRASQFRVTPDVRAGTIDELVEDYRRKLTKAVRVMIGFDGGPDDRGYMPPCDPGWQGHAQMQELLAGLCGGGTCCSANPYATVSVDERIKAFDAKLAHYRSLEMAEKMRQAWATPGATHQHDPQLNQDRQTHETYEQTLAHITRLIEAAGRANG